MADHSVNASENASKYGAVVGSKKILIVLTALNLFNYIDRYVLSSVLEPIKAEMNLTDGQLGRIATAFMLGYFVTSPIFGYLGDRFPRKFLIAAGVVVWSAGTFLTGFAATFIAIVAFRTLIGFGEASFGAIGPSLISDAYPPIKRNNALTLFYLAIPLGAALGYVLGGLIGAEFGWRHAFYWTGGPGLLLAALIFFVREPKRGESDGGQSICNGAQKPKPRDVFSLFRSREYSLVVFGYCAYTFSMGALSYWGPSFFTRVHGLTMQQASGFFGPALLAGGLIGTMGGGFLASLIAKKNRAGYAMVLAGSVLLSVPLTIGAFATSSVVTAMALSAAALVFLFVSTGPVNTVIMESCPVNLRSSAMALSIFMIHFLGDLWSPEIIGRTADACGSLQKALFILPGAFFIAGILWTCLAITQSRSHVRR